MSDTIGPARNHTGARRATTPGAATTGRDTTRPTTTRPTTTRRATGQTAQSRRTPAPPTAGPEPLAPVRRDVHQLIGDVRGALDELTVQLDLASKEGRDRVRQQAAAVEERWSAAKNELGLARDELGVALRTLRGGACDAARAALHVVDATRRGLKRR